MLSKRIGATVLALVLGFVLVGCDSDSGGGSCQAACAKFKKCAADMGETWSADDMSGCVQACDAQDVSSGCLACVTGLSCDDAMAAIGNDGAPAQCQSACSTEEENNNTGGSGTCQSYCNKSAECASAGGYTMTAEQISACVQGCTAAGIPQACLSCISGVNCNSGSAEDCAGPCQGYM